jgi:hypothetical protein
MVIVVTAILGLGMANIMAPATESIMGSLPREKAGVGSAMNDTTRQVGGAVGVALLGSILASRYGSSVHDSLNGHVPPKLQAAVHDSIGHALGVVHDVPAARPFASQIIDASKNAFVDGLRAAVFAAAIIMVCGLLMVLRYLPARAVDVGDELPVPAPTQAPAAGGVVEPALSTTSTASPVTPGVE